MRIAILTFLVTGFSAFADFSSLLQTANLRDRIVDGVTKLKVEANPTLLDLEWFDTLNSQIRYGYRVEHDQNRNLQLRMDKYVVTSSLTAGSLLREFDLPLNFGMSSGHEIIFVRQFADKMSALSAIPYTPKKLPITAERIQSELKVGDFVAFPAKVNLIVSANVLASNGMVSASAHSHYLISAELDCHLFVLPDKRVRLKLIAKRSEQVSGQLRARAGFKIFGISMVDRQIEKFLELDFFSLNISQSSGTLFVLDYVINLNDRESQIAYDTVFSSRMKFRELPILSPFIGSGDMENLLIHDASKLEDLALRHVNSTKPPVLRVFRGRDEFTHSTSRFNLGIALLRFDRQSNSSQHRITTQSPGEEPQVFHFQHSSHRASDRALFGAIQKNTVFSVSSLQPSSPNGQVQPLTDLILTYDQKNKDLLSRERQEVQNEVHRRLGPHVFSRIPWNGWEDVTTVKDLQMMQQIVFNQDGIAQLRQFDPYRRRNELRRYIRAVPSPKDVATNEGRLVPWLEVHTPALFDMVATLNQGMENFQDTLSGLRHNEGFACMGSGYLLESLRDSNPETLVQVTVRLRAKGLPPIDFQFGQSGKSDLYLRLEQVQASLNGRGFDLSLTTPQRQMVYGENSWDTTVQDSSGRVLDQSFE